METTGGILGHGLEAKVNMRAFLLSSLCLMFFAAGSTAQAKVAITVDKDAQLLTVAVDGVERYQWPVSTGNPSHETPNGSFRAFRMEEDHYSKEFDDAPMPHSIFFTKIGHAIHGTDSENRLGTPVSHGCVRLSRANASTLYALVESEGVLNTTVTLTGSSQVALARMPRTRPTAVARRDVAPPSTSYDAAGNPIDLLPQQQYAPQQIERQPLEPLQPLPPPQIVQQRPIMPQQADDRYIYPADGSDGRRYPAPRGYRRQYDAQANPQQQYYDGNGYAPQVYAPQVYAPRPYRPRGFFTD
jgi:L,D-transpeptidase-like protein